MPQAEQTSSKMLMGNVLDVLRGSKADVAGEHVAEHQEMVGGGKAMARPPVLQARIRALDFTLGATGGPGKVGSGGNISD